MLWGAKKSCSGRGLHEKLDTLNKIKEAEHYTQNDIVRDSIPQGCEAVCNWCGRYKKIGHVATLDMIAKHSQI